MSSDAVKDSRSTWAGSASRQPAPAQAPPLVVRDVRKSFGDTQVLRGIDLQVHSGALTAVLGANGCGKSTLLRCAVGLLQPDAGAILVRERDLASLRGNALRKARRETAVVFQQFALVGKRSALDNVCAGGLGRVSLARSFTPSVFPRELRLRAADALARVGMLEHAYQKARDLSGGQQQRVAIARAYCQRSSVILADEPVSALDPSAAESVMRLLADLAHGDRLAVLAVLHQPELALRYADRIIGMREGQIVFDLAPAEVTQLQIAALYDHLQPA